MEYFFEKTYCADCEHNAHNPYCNPYCKLTEIRISITNDIITYFLKNRTLIHKTSNFLEKCLHAGIVKEMIKMEQI